MYANSTHVENDMQTAESDAQKLEIEVLPDGRMDRRNAAKYTGYAEKTLAQKATNGTGPRFVKRGRVWYYKSDIDKWLAAGAATSTAAARLSK
jgi:predicted DNA-binding transcriptional regulator AlpA